MLIDIADSATVIFSHDGMSNWLIAVLSEPRMIERSVFFFAFDDLAGIENISVQISNDGLHWHEVAFECCPSVEDKSVSIVMGQVHVLMFIRISAKSKFLLNDFSVVHNDDYAIFRGCPVFIKSKTISDKVCNAIERQEYEVFEIDMALGSIQGNNNIVLELGASLGVVSTILSKSCSIKKYYCVEANSKTIEIMRINHEINKIDAKIIHGVLTNSSLQKEFDFYIHKHCWASSLEPSPHCVAIEKVKGFYFPDVLQSIQPTHIICDIEGGEYELFSSIKPESLASVRHIFMEIHPAAPQAHDALLQNLARCNFALSGDVPKCGQMSVCHFMKEASAAANQ